MSDLTREHLETFVADPHRASEDEIRAMARELIALGSPDGYVVLCKSRLLDGGWRYRTVGSAVQVHATEAEAAKYRAVSSDERAYVVAEVREVQP
ncbi:hypothetical protein OG874_00280 [Nocardia sp. NBC_00565]|uniref:hypothetical protein n=1 Tax=Nocardia sp. NBC_00565 TaxID=2975993 RepID=UPI002E82199A|nr:hypothetical protein [Nocardia sp. NBC_00565]WUC03691.1 hypothetical protein OG874_00280 [Nocardia sp. NBC_00565]